MREKQRILFILKFREGYESKPPYSYSSYFSSGLYWSAKFVVDMLVQSGVDAKLVQVIDNNDIDREVDKFKPTLVIIEALWVVPEKFDILKRLHPKVEWIVRLHSNTPFLANEGIALSWIKGYVERGIKVACNAKREHDDLMVVLGSDHLRKHVEYLPNYYPVKPRSAKGHILTGVLRVGCYGAIRPLKNQLIQAIAAIRYAERAGKTLYFHINGSRMEQGGEQIRENLRALFQGTKHKLVEDGWMGHEDFIRKLAHIDVGMQVSFSETFSIVAADMVSVGLPVVVSSEIPWAGWFSEANPSNGVDITEKIGDALKFKKINIMTNRKNLIKYSRVSKQIWLDFLK